MRLSTYGQIGHAPFVRFLLALISGIGIAQAIDPTPSLYLAAWAVLVTVVTAFVTIRWVTRMRQYRYYRVLGLLVLLAWSAVGCLLTWHTHPAIDRTHFSHFTSKALIGVVDDEPVVRGSHVRFPLAITKVYGDTGLRSASGRLMVTVRVDDSVAAGPLDYGDELLIPAGYEPVPPPYNPNELDYRGYLADKQLWHQDYLEAAQLKKLGEQKGNPIVAYALALRQQMVAKFADYLPNHDAYSVASALILGYRAEMSDSLVQAFSNTGTIHVLSVSGMHVVLVFWLLAKLLWWMDRNRGLRATKFVILLIGVWGYALLTGFSPPVLRASIMVSFVMAARIFSQQNRIYNSIAASAFFLLLYNPGFIADIGFQLSYLAVLGIVFFQPVMRSLFPARHAVLRPLTDYMGMSIGAQAGAGPLAAYYFHQFPLYFLPANLAIVVPASAIMYIGFALLVLPTGPFTQWVGKVLEKLILTTNTMLGHIEQWPMASIRGVWPAWWETFLLYGLMAAVAMAVMVRNKQWVYGVLGCMTLLVCSSFSEVFRDTGRSHAIVFNVRRHLAIGLIAGQQAWLYTDLPSLDDRTIGYAVLPVLEARVPARAIRLVPNDRIYRDRQVYANGGVLQFGDLRIWVYDGTGSYEGRLTVDAVLVRNNPRTSLAELLKSVDCGMLIMDGSNYGSVIARWTAEAEAASVPLYVLKDNFAYFFDGSSSGPTDRR